MILGNKAIKEEMEKGNILISPFHEDFLNNTSYDVRLDRYFIFPKTGDGSMDVTDKNLVENLYESWLEADSIVLNPGEKVLASTIEQIGSLSMGITSEIGAKSSFGRSVGLVCGCANGGDPGYATHWTLELVNTSPHKVLLKYGTVIAQIRFSKVEGCDRLYSNKYNANGGKSRTYLPEERRAMIMPKALRVVIDDPQPIK